jgi:hypothetical protein
MVSNKQFVAQSCTVINRPGPPGLVHVVFNFFFNIDSYMNTYIVYTQHVIVLFQTAACDCYHTLYSKFELLSRICYIPNYCILKSVWRDTPLLYDLFRLPHARIIQHGKLKPRWSKKNICLLAVLQETGSS